LDPVGGCSFVLHQRRVRAALGSSAASIEVSAMVEVVMGVVAALGRANVARVKIAMASDHAGFGLKQELKALLPTGGHVVVDFRIEDESVCDLVDFAYR
jgi:hypothetical protein